jgi:hypothetical protein
MPDNTHSHSLQDAEDQHQHPDDLNRQDYQVRVSAGQKLVVPTVFEGIQLPLAHTNKPDFSKALNMPMGVSLSSLLPLKIS